MKGSRDGGCLSDTYQLSEAGEAPDALVESVVPEDHHTENCIDGNELVPGFQIDLIYPGELAVESEPECNKKSHIDHYGIV